MAIQEGLVGITVHLRNIEDPLLQAYAEERLWKVIVSLPNLRRAEVEVTFEATKPKELQYVAQVTLEANGVLLRVENRQPSGQLAVDSVHDLLARRIGQWKGRVYYERRRRSSAWKDTVATEATRLRPEDQAGWIVRRKSHEIKPMFPEDAVEQMELVGHDFFFFLNAETHAYNVVYRRRAGGYGLIEPAVGASVG